MHYCFMMSWLIYIQKNITRFLKVKTKGGGKDMVIKI